MASTDTTTLKKIGQDILESFVAVTVETFIFAVYAVLVAKTATIFLRKSRRRRTSLITLAAVIVLFLLDAVLWIIDVRNVIVELKITFISDSTETLDAKYSASGDTVLHLVSVQTLLYAYMTIIGDAIVIWRAYAFCWNGKERLFLLLPCAMFLASIISTIMLTYCVDRVGGDIVVGAFRHPALCRNMQETSYAATVATTAVATFLIGYKTWQYRRSIRFSLDEAIPKTRIEKVMVILVESGVLYFLFFLSPVIFSIGNLQARADARTNLHFAATVYQYMTSTIVGVYPTIIVVLVKSQMSFIDSTANSTRGVVSDVIEFKPATSSADASTYSRTGAGSRHDAVDVIVHELRSGSFGQNDTDEEKEARKELKGETKAEGSSVLV